MRAQSASWKPSWKYRKPGSTGLPWPMWQMEDYRASWLAKEERPQDPRGTRRPLTPEQSQFIDGFTPRQSLSRSSSSLVGDRRGEDVLGIMTHGRGGVSVESLHNGAATARRPTRSFGELHAPARSMSGSPNPSGYYALPAPAVGPVSHESFRVARIYESPEARKPFDPQGRSSSLSLRTSLSLSTSQRAASIPPEQRPMQSGWATSRGRSKGMVFYWA